MDSISYRSMTVSNGQPMQIRKYNPGFLSDEELITSFCARNTEYASIVEALRECTSASNQHLLVIGPRGSGKTTLLLRVAAELQRDSELASRLLPVLYAEESYQVSTCGEFWLECLARLADQVPPHVHDIDLARSYEDLRRVTDDETLELRCLGGILDFAELVDRRLVLVVENLNTMFADMMDPDAGWRLRKTLQTEPRIVLLGSATSRFDEIDHPDRALYDLFHVHSLQPLTTEECSALWESVSGKKPARDRIRALEILTGGSPRLVAIVAQFGATLSFHNLMGDLLDLVDAHTEYFKSHVESLPGQERRVYLAIAEQWIPATTRDIAHRARIDTSKCSAWLKRLADRGLVAVAGGTPRRLRYVLTERMYNIYYLLRVKRGTSRVVEALVRFMASFYSPTELRSIRNQVKVEWLNSTGDTARYYPQLIDKLSDVAETTPEDLAESLETSNRVLASLTDDLTPQDKATILFDQAVALGKLGRTEEEIRRYDLIAAQYRHANTFVLQEVVARSLINKGIVLGHLNRLDEELETYEELLAGPSADGTSVLTNATAKALCLKGGTLELLGREDEALMVYDELARRFGKEGSSEIREIVATGQIGKAEVALRRKRFKAAIAAATDALDLLDSDVTYIDVFGRAVRATGTLHLDDVDAARRDASEMLEFLPDLDRLPHSCLSLLIELYVRIGPQPMMELIQASPSRDLLYPLSVVAQRNVGLEPVVSPEVEEVAKDIQHEIDKRRSST